MAKPGDLLASNGDGSTHIQIVVENDCVVTFPVANNPGYRCGNSITHNKGKFTLIRIKE